tara:strand:+ start:17232 stop:17867 length:636 start_codon:yes stop_codon:yes gene_type:complete
VLQKGYITISLILLAILGASKDYSQVPNQEILLQFQQEAISASDADQAIANIEQRLASIGVSHVQVIDSGDGLLKILYYSDLESVEIARMLGADNTFALDLTTVPFGKNSSGEQEQEKEVTYQLNVVELQSDSDAPWHLNGESFQYSNTKFRGDHSVVYAAGRLPIFTTIISVAEVKEIATAIPYLGYKNLQLLIPEIRAGPTSIGVEGIS